MTKFFKNSKKKNNLFWCNFGSFFTNLGKNEFSWKKGFCQFLNILIICDCTKKPQKTNDPSREN